MNNFFLIDKPSGITSFELLRNMRRMAGTSRIGHTGTLDPLATGCMLVATGEYTKCISLLEGKDKTYVANILLDGASPSHDIDTPVKYITKQKQNAFSKKLSLNDLNLIFKKNFLGKIQQIPPKYSALKIGGKRALDRTLAGEDLIMKPREVEVYYYKILEFKYPLVRIELCVSSGTYIRSIAHDLGCMIGSGGYISALRRIQIGNLDISDAINISHSHHTDTFLADKYINIQELFGEKLVCFQDEPLYKRLALGQRVRGNFAFGEGSRVILFDGNHIRYIIEYKKGVIHPRKKICAS